jgi:pyruvate/2-oxoglutarate/acetoin dehydrogenase E1 component
MSTQNRYLSVAEAIREAQVQLMKGSRDVFVIGEGVPDPKGCFGTTKGLKEQFPDRVFDMPVSENGMTGVCIGAAVAGMRPIMVHMRADFLLYAADQIINNAAKWWAMFGGQAGPCPIVIRAVIGRGWGQGLQHSQHLENMFGSIPGLNVMCPSNAYDAKGMLIKASRSKNPTLFFEHRWIHSLKCHVPEEMYEVSMPTLVRSGSIGVTAWGYMVHECMKAAEFLSTQGIELRIVDSRAPCSSSSSFDIIKEDSLCPPSPALSKDFYPTIEDIVVSYGGKITEEIEQYCSSRPHDVPNEDFMGPF